MDVDGGSGKEAYEAVETPLFRDSWNMMLLWERGEPRHAEAQAAAPAGAVRCRVA